MDLQTLAIVVALAFLPPLVFLLWVRNHERHQREPLLSVLGLFAYGGTLGVVIALALTMVLGAGFGASPSGLNLLSLVVIAPLAEEMAKGLGLGFARRRILEVEDGIIYGAAIGLGFGATENLLYGLKAFADSSGTSSQDSALQVAAITIAFRVFSSVLLHAGSCALLGYGYARMRLSGRGLIVLLPFYLLAVAQHALYNFLVGPQALIGFAAGVVMVLIVTTLLRRAIRRLDARPMAAMEPPV